jgi:hypothetical protein
MNIPPPLELAVFPIIFVSTIVAVKLLTLSKVTTMAPPWPLGR